MYIEIQDKYLLLLHILFWQNHDNGLKYNLFLIYIRKFIHAKEIMYAGRLRQLEMLSNQFELDTCMPFNVYFPV